MALADEINRMIKKIVDGMLITSAGGDSPKTNRVIDTGEEENPDLESLVKDSTIKNLDKGNIGEINRLTSQQIGNLKSFVENPAGFVIGKVFGRVAKGAGVIALALVIFEAVKFVIKELLLPGRFLDLRFKRDITKELIAFRQREDQQKLKQGFSNIIITSTPRLRLTAQTSVQVTNTLDLVRGNQLPENFGFNPFIHEASGLSRSKSKGRRQNRR